MTTPAVQREAFDFSPEPPCNHGAWAGVDGVGHCLLCPATSADALPLTPAGAGSPLAAPSLAGVEVAGSTVGAVPAPRSADPTPVVLAAVHSDPLPHLVAARRVLRVAITECAARHQGRVHVAWFRHFLPEWIDPHTVGAAISGWTKAGYLEAIPDQWEPNGSGSNARKPTQIRRLAHPIPPIA